VGVIQAPGDESSLIVSMRTDSKCLNCLHFSGVSHGAKVSNMYEPVQYLIRLLHCKGKGTGAAQ
jgi:hypothetical protein